jgi:hypothetical protein
MTVVITGIIFNSVMALVVGSVFYNLPNDTSSLYSRGALLFFGIQLAAFASALEVREDFEAHACIVINIEQDLDPIGATSNRGETFQVCLLPSICRSSR